jgi:type IV pilus assembly protein PilY1
MKKLTIICILYMFSAFSTATALAAPDQYPGDSSIYGVQAPLQPNVLIVIDDSGSMADTVLAGNYDPATTYPVHNNCVSSGGYSGRPCSANAVYTVGSSTDKTADGYVNADVNNIVTSCNSVNPRLLLQTTGFYNGRSLKTNGTVCRSSGVATYATGNYINYLNTPGSGYTPKIDVAKNVIENLITSTSNVKFGLMTFRYVSGSGHGGQLVKTTSVPGAGTTPFVAEVKKMDDVFTGSVTNRTALIAAVDSLSTEGNTPLGETLFEAGRYFSGAASAFSATNGIAGGTYTSPVEATCQKNYIVFVSDGMSNADNTAVLKTIGTNGDFDGDTVEPGDLNHSLDDIAKHLNTTLSYDGHTLNIVTYTIGFGLSGANQDAIDLLTRTADTTHGKGGYFAANSQTDLSAAFTTILTEIYAVNSSYVAPVVPVSPQNRTYGGSRVYMGFFKPTNSAWQGNLKKYAIDVANNIVDVDGNLATWEDTNGNFQDDRAPHAALPSGAVNGSFRTTSKSFWSASVDAGNVDVGGVGELLQTTSGLSRTLYTLTPTGTSLIGLNSTTSGVQNITPAMLDVADTTASAKLINFIYGLDAYDADGNSDMTENREWIMGDILHSRPVIVNYASYTFSAANETSCATNKSLIFVGSNDGMLHAFKDCDGTEAWGFVPPDVLPHLKNMTDVNKSYYVDSTVSTYVHDKNSNGNIEPLQGDKVILLFGIRRGSGTAAAPTSGAYYALDVTIPASPAFLWKMSNSSPTSGSPAVAVFPELGESWSEPKLVRMKYGSPATAKIVALVGAGYDNANEDGRYGATQTFPATASGVAPSMTGSGADTSSGTSSPTNPKGRGIYAIELASLSESGSPPTVTASVAASATKIWGYTYGSTVTSSASGKTDPGVTFSFPSEIAAIDSLNSGYANILYAADTGGNIWRFDVGDANTANWTGKKIFSSNPGSGGATDVGRKIFYKPSIVSEAGYRMIIFGTGDREHPLNTNVVDRIYVLKDPGTITTTKTESNLVDLTSDLLQTTTSAGIASIITQLNASTNFGWYIKLDENAGEKVLSAPMVFNKVIYATTYSPEASSTDICVAGNLGTSRLYALNYKTGEAVLNYNTGNDTDPLLNDRAKCSGGGILARSDRVKTTGSGIPSGVVVLVTPGGQTNLLTGVGGAIAGEHPLPGGSIIPLYWRQK